RAALGARRLDHRVLDLSGPAALHQAVHDPGPRLGAEPDLRGLVGLLFLWRRQLAVPAVAADDSAARLLLPRAGAEDEDPHPLLHLGERLRLLRPLRPGTFLPRA